MARDAVLASLRAARSVLVIGEAGVGKTHLVSAALARWAHRAPGGEEETGYPGLGGPPQDPTVQVPEGLGRSARIVRVQGPTPSAPAVLHVEDAHLLDPTTAEALALMVRQGEVVLVATMRPAGAKTWPWLDLWKDDAAERVDLRSFSPAEAEALVEESLGGPITGDTSRRIWRQTQGNPYYLRELIRHEVECGALVERDGVWVGLVGAEPGQRVLDAVEHDLERLPDRMRSALELIALSEPIAVSTLDGLVDTVVLDALVHDGLVTTGKSPAGVHGVGRAFDDPVSPIARLSPPAYADAVRALVPLSRRRRLLAKMLAARPGYPTERELSAGLLRSVLWALECDSHQSGKRLLSAMRAAFALCRPDVVVQVGTAALRQSLGSAGMRVDVLLLRARAWRLLGEPERAGEDLFEASQRLGAEHTGGEHRLRQVRLAGQIADLHEYYGDAPDRSLVVIDDILAELDRDGDEQVRTVLEISRLVRLGAAGRFTESVEPSLAHLGDVGFGSEHAIGLVAPTVVGLAQTGRLGEATALGRRSLSTAGAFEGQHPLLVAGVRAGALMAHLWAGDVDAAALIAVPHGGGNWSHYLQYAADNTGRGLIAAARGLWSEARREHHTAVVSLGVLDPSGYAPYAAAAEAVAAAALGDRVAAVRLLDEARGPTRRSAGVLDADRRLLVLDAQLWLGELGSRAAAVALARWSAERGLRRVELEALHRALVAGHLDGISAPSDAAVLDRLRRLGGVVSGRRPKAVIAHAEAMVAGDDDLLTVTGRELGAAGLWLPAVRTTAQLTPREREIAGLAAGGLSSRAIAERLTLSVRTVDSHLSRVFAKLGVRSRRELRDL